MQPELTRTAFTLAPLHRRRDAHRITAVALHQRAGRIYLGLENGVLEEHRLVASTTAPSTTHAQHVQHQHTHAAAAHAAPPALRLQAEKHLFRGAVASLAIAFAAARVAALSDDGQVTLCTLESFHLAPVPAARGATAIATDPSPRFPAQLAVAVRVARGRSRVGVYDVVPGSASASGHGALQKHQVRCSAVGWGGWVGSVV
jgi:hypothetical protein